jgi:hypothetical protein
MITKFSPHTLALFFPRHIIKVTPNSDRAKEIIAERAAKQKKELEFKRLEAQVRKMYGRAVK